MIKQIEFKADFKNILSNGEIEIRPIHEAKGEINIIMECNTEHSIIDKINNYFTYYDKKIEMQPNEDIVYTISGSFYRSFKDFEKYINNISKVGF